jgi:hypothetical protein
MTGEFPPVTESSAWTASDLAEDESWDFELNRAQRDELMDATSASVALSLPDLVANVPPLPHCQSVLSGIAESLRSGRGFALLHRFPIEEFGRESIEKMYWLFCCHLGVGVTQNSDATLIHYVTEGKLRPNQGTRGVGNPGPVSLHVDLADCVSLLCVRQAIDSPPSRLASSTHLYNVLREQHPQWLPRLFEGFIWDRQNEHGPLETPASRYKVPLFSRVGSTVSCRYNRNWMQKAAERVGSGFTPDDAAMLDEIDSLSHTNCFEFDFQPGDVQFANNYTILHGRAPHAPAASEDQTRLLMRIWFDMCDMRKWSDEALIRYGIIRHGKLGWTASEQAQGLDGKVHARDAGSHKPLLAPARVAHDGR